MEKILANQSSISKKIYSRLVFLYPQSFLRKHGDEMIQNFEDLERDAGSRRFLWAFIISDLVKSLTYEYMEFIKRNRWAQLVLAVFLVLVAIGIWQTVKLHRAHSTFDNYAAFRGCKMITSRTDNDGTCRLENGQLIKIVKFNDKWYLDGDLPMCVNSFCF